MHAPAPPAVAARASAPPAVAVRAPATPLCVLVPAFAAAVATAPVRASAERPHAFYEAVAGVSQPGAASAYQDFADTSLKLGARAGQAWPFDSVRGRLGWEFALDWTKLVTAHDNAPDQDASFSRLRALVGARAIWPWGPRARVFARALLGGEQLIGTIDSKFFGAPHTEDYGSFGIAFEPGGGADVGIGSVAVGAQVAIPIAYRFERNEAIDYGLSVDVDLLLTVSKSY